MHSPTAQPSAALAQQAGHGLLGFPARAVRDACPEGEIVRVETDAAGLLSCLFRWIIAHVDVPGEVGPNSGCRTGVYAFEVGEQVRTQPVNLAAGFQ